MRRDAMGALEKLCGLCRLAPFAAPQGHQEGPQALSLRLDLDPGRARPLREPRRRPPLKWVDYQQDVEGRDYALGYDRDVQGREVDFEGR